jgi:hypothetical protein
MPAAYTIDEAAGVVRVTVSTDVQVHEITAVLSNVLNDPRVPPDMPFLVDRRGMEVAPTATYIRATIRMIADHQQRLGTRRWAVVIEPLPDTFEMGIVAERLGELHGVPVRLFTDYGDALRWLKTPS